MEIHHKWNTSSRPLILGFLFSLILTIAAYLITVQYNLSSWVLALTLLILAGVQSLVQLVFFMHLGVESKPRWNLMIFVFMVLVVSVLVVGSLWIMHNLNYNTMPMDSH